MENGIKKFYCEEEIFTKWENFMDVGKSIVPSVYVPEYRSFIVDILEKVVGKDFNKKILSIGSGVGVIEKLIQDKGYNNIVCLELFEDAVSILRSKGLIAECEDVTNLSATKEIHLKSDVVYLDGVIGHLASSYQPPFDNCYIESLLKLRKLIKENGFIVFSDDVPYKNDASYEINPSVCHLRISDELFLHQLHQVNFKLLEVEIFPYIRPQIGWVKRRIVVASV